MAKLAKSSEARPASGDPVFGANLRAARLRAKKTQDRLADACGVSKGLISQYEKGLTAPSLSALRRMSSELGIPVDALLFGNHQPTRQPVFEGMALDDRIRALPEALRESVLISLQRAEAAVRHLPANFITPPTSDNWAEFNAYLEALWVREEKKGKP